VTHPESEPVALGEAAYRWLRAEIVACRIAPGQRLTERKLAAETGFGVSPIRDALTRLDHEGLVRTVPRSGYQVKPLTIKAVDDLFEYWSILGPEVARRGTVGASPEQIEQATAVMKDAACLNAQQGTVREIALQGVEFARRLFSILAEGTGNEYILAAYKRLESELSRVWILVIDSELLDSGISHAAAYDWAGTLARRDGERAAAHAREYIEESHHRVLRTLARWPSVITSEVVPLSRDAQK
jgi:DNA-binding GntR family transcriptional regulator